MVAFKKDIEALKESAQKRRFAIQRRREIARMGFRKNTAKKVVRAAGPWLSLASVIWAKDSFATAKEALLNGKERKKLSDDPVVKGHGHTPTDDAEVADEIKSAIELALDQIRDRSSTVQRKKDAFVMSAAKEQFKSLELIMPSEVIEDAEKILEGAYIALDDIPELEAERIR